jgi:hypothetical protein
MGSRISTSRAVEIIPSCPRVHHWTAQRQSGLLTIHILFSEEERCQERLVGKGEFAASSGSWILENLSEAVNWGRRPVFKRVPPSMTHFTEMFRRYLWYAVRAIRSIVDR